MKMAINYELLPDFFFGKIKIINIPQGTRVIAVYDEYEKQQITFLIENDQFESVMPGSDVPILAVVGVDVKKDN